MLSQSEMERGTETGGVVRAGHCGKHTKSTLRHVETLRRKANTQAEQPLSPGHRHGARLTRPQEPKRARERARPYARACRAAASHPQGAPAPGLGCGAQPSPCSGGLSAPTTVLRPRAVLPLSLSPHSGPRAPEYRRTARASRQRPKTSETPPIPKRAVAAPTTRTPPRASRPRHTDRARVAISRARLRHGARGRPLSEEAPRLRGA